MISQITPGIYRHYSGHYYQVIEIALHSETHEPMVVYRALYDSPDYGANALWVRPLTMFQETVILGDTSVPRFTYVSNDDPQNYYGTPLQSTSE